MPGPLRATARVLGPLRPDSIRNRILLFALVAALVPSITTAWVAYQQGRRAILSKTTQDLRIASQQAIREMELWLKERLHDLRTFTGSYEITENVERAGRDPAAASRILVYLTSVLGRFPEHAELFVLDARGRLVAQTGGTSPALPADPMAGLRMENQLVGEPVWDPVAREPRVTLLVAIRPGAGQLLGALGVETRFRAALSSLLKYAPDGGRAYLTTNDRRVIVASDTASRELLAHPLPARFDPLFEAGRTEGQSVEYEGLAGEPVLGTPGWIPTLRWTFVAEVPTLQAYREVRALRNLAIAILVGLVLGIGFIAYRLGLLIVRPLDRLTRGAAEVAGGDFTVDLPPAGGGEVGILTRVFNDMVAKLREGRASLDAANETLRRQNEQLERLSVTDGLTGLYNRRRLMELLETEIERSKRLEHVCAILMMDVDHFKRYNDAHGHQAGDGVLRGVGAVLHEATREIDWAARYGGEEFFVLLPETDVKKATEVAERIRARLKERIFLGGRVTLSIGVAEYPRNGETPEELIAAADGALYQAKREGRDRVVQVATVARDTNSQRGG
jgi:diguanylate cyclase (GGDEF)-like protein